MVCIMPVAALTGVRVSGSAPIARLPTPSTDVRLPMQMLQVPRSKLLDCFPSIVHYAGQNLFGAQVC